MHILFIIVELGASEILVEIWIVRLKIGQD